MQWASCMSDPRLNSIHLESFRREEFRRAREVLLGSVGERTCKAVEEQVLHSRTQPNQTILDSIAGKLGPTQQYALVDKDAVYELRVGLNTIGRLSDNDVVVPDPYLSRRHCAIMVHATKGCELHDVASKNGTFVNGKKIAGPTLLTSGDEIRMCDRNLVFVCRADPPKQQTIDNTMVG